MCQRKKVQPKTEEEKRSAAAVMVDRISQHRLHHTQFFKMKYNVSKKNPQKKVKYTYFIYVQKHFQNDNNNNVNNWA